MGRVIFLNIFKKYIIDIVEGHQNLKKILDGSFHKNLVISVS